jgi:amino acid transporter
LCWAVVFADIGTSVYYVPGILYGQFGPRSAIFVAMTLVVFVLLTVKYAEVAWRFPEGGGVVTVASRALHPFVGLLGGLFIVVDYYLTAAISVLSGVLYLSVVVPALKPIYMFVTVAGLIGLGVLNAVGIKESARASASVAILAATGQLLVVLAVAVSLGPAGIAHSFQALAHGPRLTPGVVITGYAAAFLAFSGLESIAQLSPAMREPRREVARRAMAMVVATMAVTSPLLTLWSTTLLPPNADRNQFISILGAHVGGQALGNYVAISGALLLIFASNTAIIGAYHVFLALTRMGFLPRGVEHHNRWRRTPEIAILLAVGVPIVVLVAAKGAVDFLGDLYAFGLLGAFILTCLGLDVVRWGDPGGRRDLRGRARFWIGVLTTALVTVAWCVNLVNKPLATFFGGGLTLVGLVVGFGTYAYARRHRPSVFPLPYRPERLKVPVAEALRMRDPEVLVILPHDPIAAESVITEAAREAQGKRAVFLYRGQTAPGDYPQLMEVTEPYLRDYDAQDAFARAESLARKTIPERRYVYVPATLLRSAVGDVWRDLHPGETVLADGDQDVLPPVALDRVRRRNCDGVAVLHLVTGRPKPLQAV